MSNDDDLPDDVMWGVPAIAKFIKRTPRQTNYLIQRGRIPVTRHGHRTISATKSELRRHFTHDKGNDRRGERT